MRVEELKSCGGYAVILLVIPAVMGFDALLDVLLGGHGIHLKA